MENRVWHYLRPNKGSTTPGDMIFVDCETIPNDPDPECEHTTHRLRLWCGTHVRLSKGLVTRRTCARGMDAPSFWRWLRGRLSKKRQCWVWAHNVSFDMIALGLPAVVESGEWSWQQSRQEMRTDGQWREIIEWEGLVVLDDPPTIIQLRHRDSGISITVLDTLNFWRCPLADLGEAIGRDKWPMPGWDGTDSEWEAYCWNDVVIIELAVLKLVETIHSHDLGHLRYTAAGQGMQAYRHRFMKHKILVHCDENALRLERDSYYGGLCQVRRAGVVDGPIYVVDYQSYYPSIMRTQPLPFRLVASFAETPIINTPHLCRHFHCIGRVKIKSDSVSYPVRISRSTVMAVGQFETTLSHAELCSALEAGHVDQVLALSCYEADILFWDMMTDLWLIRQRHEMAGNRPMAEMVKLVMNGTLGKFGQRNIRWIDDHGTQAPEPWATWNQIDCADGVCREFRSMNWRVQRRRLQGEPITEPACRDKVEGDVQAAINDESSSSVPAIPSAVTSYGRVLLARAIAKAGERQVYYADTDCLHVSDTGLEAIERSGLIKASEIGRMSVRSKARQAEYRGLKYYRLDDQWVVSGLKRQHYDISPGVWDQSQFSGWSSMLYSGADTQIEQTRVRLDRSHEVAPGVIGDDGWVSPIRLGG